LDHILKTTAFVEKNKAAPEKQSVLHGFNPRKKINLDLILIHEGAT
jgi:hypothetical protein